MGDTVEDDRVDVDSHTEQQLSLLRRPETRDGLGGINTAPLFTYAVSQHARRLATSTSLMSFPQYGLLAGDVQSLENMPSKDPRIFYNVATPSSVFICGSQGSGKSHTLSCILENCMIQSDRLGRLPRPLTGIVFNYDEYTSDTRVAPCEAAYLGSDPSISVRVLCAPTNITVIEVPLNDFLTQLSLLTYHRIHIVCSRT
jgi:DNA replication protein DnaC